MSLGLCCLLLLLLLVVAVISVAAGVAAIFWCLIFVAVVRALGTAVGCAGVIRLSIVVVDGSVVELCC